MDRPSDAESAPRAGPSSLSDVPGDRGLRLAPATVRERDRDAERDEWQLVAQVQAYLEARRRRAIPAAELTAAWERFYRTYRPLVIDLSSRITNHDQLYCHGDPIKSSGLIRFMHPLSNPTVVCPG